MTTPEPQTETPKARRIAGNVLIALAWLAAGAWLLRDRIQPRFVLVDPRIEVGAVPAGGTTEVRFRIENRGIVPLQIREVIGSCGCLTPQFPRSLPPLGKGEIVTRFEPLPEWSGPMDKTLTIRTSDPLVREAKAHMIAQVEPLFRLEPALLPPFRYHPGETLRHTLRLTPRPRSGVELTAATTEAPFIKARLQPPAAGDPRAGYELEVEVGPCKMAGDFQLPVKLTTTAAAVPVMNVMVRGEAQRGPVISPLRIFEPTFRKGNAGDEMLQARVFTREGKLHLKSVKTTVPGIDVRTQPDVPQQSYVLTLVQNRILASGPHEGQLVVTTDDRTHPTISIPIHITVQ